MLAGEAGYYTEQQRQLTAAFAAEYGPQLGPQLGPAAAAGAAGTAAAAETAGPAAAAAAAGSPALEAALQAGVAARLAWVPRAVPRKFGRVLPGEVEACRAVAQRHGVLLDPIWHLAAWEEACRLAAGGTPAHDRDCDGSGSGSSEGAAAAAAPGELIAMLHTGGTLGLCGLAQRFPDRF